MIPESLYALLVRKLLRNSMGELHILPRRLRGGATICLRAHFGRRRAAWNGGDADSCAERTGSELLALFIMIPLKWFMRRTMTKTCCVPGSRSGYKCTVAQAGFHFNESQSKELILIKNKNSGMMSYFT